MITPHFVHSDCVLYNNDALDVMPYLYTQNTKINLVIVDPPYGTTNCKWDSVIPLNLMWDSLLPICGKNTPICIFGMEPFSSVLRCSNLKMYKYDWIWEKSKGTGFLNAKRQPMRCHENICVFYDKQSKYFPQKTQGHPLKKVLRRKEIQVEVYNKLSKDSYYSSDERYPRSVQSFKSDTRNSSLHPTQKPVKLIEYLIKTYSEEGDTVLDFTVGSGTTAIAAMNTNRKFIGIEKDKMYFEIAKKEFMKILNKIAILKFFYINKKTTKNLVRYNALF